MKQFIINKANKRIISLILIICFLPNIGLTNPAGKALLCKSIPGNSFFSSWELNLESFKRLDGYYRVKKKGPDISAPIGFPDFRLGIKFIDNEKYCKVRLEPVWYNNAEKDNLKLKLTGKNHRDNLIAKNYCTWRSDELSYEANEDYIFLNFLEKYESKHQEDESLIFSINRKTLKLSQKNKKSKILSCEVFNTHNELDKYFEDHINWLNYIDPEKIIIMQQELKNKI